MTGTGALLVFCLLLDAAGVADSTFPKAEWQTRSPEALDMDGARLDALAEMLQGRGCVVKDGVIVKTWGDQAERSDWFSAAKPVISTLLFFAIEEGLVKDEDHTVADFGW